MGERKIRVYNEVVHIVTLFLSEKLDLWINEILRGTGDFDFDLQDKVLTENMMRCAERIKRMLLNEKLEKEEQKGDSYPQPKRN